MTLPTGGSSVTRPPIPAQRRAERRNQTAAAQNASASRVRQCVASPERRQVVVNRVQVVRRPSFLSGLRAFFNGGLVSLRDVAVQFAVNPDTQQSIVSDSGDADSAGLSAMMDSDYLLNSAQVVRGSDGNYLSLNEAVTAANDEPAAFDKSDIDAAADSYRQMKAAYDNEDAAAFALAAEAFGQQIDKANQQIAAGGSN